MYLPQIKSCFKSYYVKTTSYKL